MAVSSFEIWMVLKVNSVSAAVAVMKEAMSHWRCVTFRHMRKACQEVLEEFKDFTDVGFVEFESAV